MAKVTDFSEKTIPLEFPVADGKITELQLRKPSAGDMRGIKLLDIIHLDAAAVVVLLGRISLNGFEPEHFYQLDPVDLLTVMTEVATFFTSSTRPTA